MYIGFILNGRNNLEYCRMLSSDANDLDRRFGEFCFSQVRKQLKGAYLPEERIYCIEAADGDKNRVESLVRDIIDRGAWPSDDHQRLRDIGFVHETADSYRRTDSRDFIVGELERTLHNGRAGRLLEAYHDFHRSREKDTGNRVLTAIQTGQGVLLFDDTGRGLERAESYLQYNADNFFSPIHRNTDKLGVYYFSTDNARLVEKARECGRMFAPDDRCSFIPARAEFLRADILRGCKPAVECDMSPDLARYREMLKTFKLMENETPFNIGILDRLCRTGDLDEMPENRNFRHSCSFSSLRSQMSHSFLSSQADTLLGNSMRQAVSDTARRILQNEYDVRGYSPTPDTRRRREKKPEKTGKRTNIGR